MAPLSRTTCVFGCPYRKFHPLGLSARIGRWTSGVLELFNLLKWILLDLFRSRSSLEAEVIALRHQLNVLRRGAPKRPALKIFDRLIFVLLYRLAPTVSMR
jgi:hypothetical protein